MGRIFQQDEGIHGFLLLVPTESNYCEPNEKHLFVRYTSSRLYRREDMGRFSAGNILK